MYCNNKVDMTASGQAVKKARENNGWSREKLAEILGIAPRYVMYIETRGQHTSLQKMYEIATLFNISVDQFFFPAISERKTTLRRQLDAILDDMDDRELSVITATAEAMQKNKKAGE